MMSYFAFNYVTDPPNDQNVDEVIQLNNNWSEVDTKTNAFNQQPANFTGITIPVGTEAFDPDPAHAEPHRIAVWTGSIWSRGVDHTTTWTAWQTLGLRAPVVARTGFPPVARIDAFARRIVLSGGVQLNATADPWSTSTTYEITDDVSIQASLAPVNGGTSIQQAATGQITTANGFASAVVSIDLKSTPSRTAISVRYQGDAGGGNFIMLDGIEWWY